ncbi:MAG: calcium-binding protein, partial [Pseudodonghicola sp.]
QVTLGNQQDDATFSINLYARENVVTTGSAHVQSIDTGGVAGLAIGDAIRIGAGGAGIVDTGGGVDRVTTTTGGVRAISTHDGKDVIKTGAGYVGFVDAGEGNDRVVVGAGGAGLVKAMGGNDSVVTGAGWVEAVTAGDGNDLVRIGGGGGGLVRLGAGDDRIAIRPTDPTHGLTVLGGSGTDTIDFSAFKRGVTFTLDSGGAWQNPAAKAGSLAAVGQGFVQETSIENLIGTAKGDRLSGDEADNLLNGRNGNDVLAGGAGDDTLIGGGGGDTFVFGANGGTDRVQDYARSADQLRIADHSGGFAGLTIGDQGADLKIVYDGGTILLLGAAGTHLTAGDFDFV